jgi:tripartite-type tricarboxylate transporter receptor subunit TctC
MVMPIGPMAVVPHVYKDITYDPIKDFTPIAIGATFQFAFAASPKSGAKDVGRVRAVGEGEPGQGRLRDVGRRKPARISSACCSDAASASTWSTCRTRALPRMRATSSPDRSPAPSTHSPISPSSIAQAR